MKEKEVLYEESLKLKLQQNAMKDENVKLKTKIKMLENEIARKEKALEDMFSNNLPSFHKPSNSNTNLAPLS